jgi:hypothetical protein
MALRDKLYQRSTKFLEPGEQVQAVFLAQSGPSPYWLLLTTVVVFFTGYRIVVVTDRAIIVERSSLWSGAVPKQVLARLPRTQQLGPLSGLWGKLQLGPTRLWVHKRFHRDVTQADAALHAMYGSPAGPAQYPSAGPVPGSGPMATPTPSPMPGQPIGQPPYASPGQAPAGPPPPTHPAAGPPYPPAYPPSGPPPYPPR